MSIAPCWAEDATILATGNPASPDLKDILEKGLKARRPEEFAFIQIVLDHVDNGTLSRAMVEGTFAWARQHSKNEFQYFQFAIRERAKRIGVTL